MIKEYRINASYDSQYLEVSMTFYAKSDENIQQAIDYINSIGTIDTKSEALKTTEYAAANELALVKKEIATAATNGLNKVSLKHFIWKSTRKTLLGEGYTINEGSSSITVSWGQ
jgi:hypothetical protein